MYYYKLKNNAIIIFDRHTRNCKNNNISCGNMVYFLKILNWDTKCSFRDTGANNPKLEMTRPNSDFGVGKVRIATIEYIM